MQDSEFNPPPIQKKKAETQINAPKSVFIAGLSTIPKQFKCSLASKYVSKK
jgi:hypothetical protein